MTWVIGGNTIFGYGLMVSDIQVSWSNGVTKDCVQKIYPMGNHLFAGFSGSVKIGFRLLQDLKDFLVIDEADSQKYGWHPDWVAENWQSRAKAVFNSEFEVERANGAEIIIVGTDPKKDIGIVGMPLIYTCKLRWPSFDPTIHKGKIQFDSIGSGSGVEIYREKLEKVSSEFEPLKMEVGMKGGYGLVVMETIADVIRKNPQPGISQHLHVAMIQRGRYSLQNNDTTMYESDGTKTQIRMPSVATSYSDFLEICGAATLDAAAASC